MYKEDTMRERKTIKGMRKALAVTLAAAMLAPMLSTGAGAVNATLDDASYTGATYNVQYVSERISNNYSKVSSAYTFKSYTGEAVAYPIADILEGAADKLTSETRGYSAADKVLSLGVDDVVETKLTVPEDGLYVLSFDYYSCDTSVLPIELSMEVDGVYPFYECRNIELISNWIPQAEKSFDRYNDQVVTVPDKAIRWEMGYFEDSSYRHSEALQLQLSAGEHSFRFTVGCGNFLLGGLTLSAPKEIPAYTGSQVAEGAAMIDLQGEEFSSSNDSSIHGVAEYDSSVTPYEVSDTVLNTLDSDSFDAAGQSVTYTFDVTEAGYYNVSMNYRQSDKTDFPVFVDIRVDGELPNTAFQAYPMAYTTKYKQHTLSDTDGNALSVYLEPGTHSITYTISLDPICYILEEVEEIMAGVNDLALEITKVAGTNADKYRDLKLSRYIPNLEATLYGYADRLIELEQSALVFSGREENVAVMSSMIIAAEQLNSLAENPDEIPYRIAELSSSINSVNQNLANTIDALLENGLAIDRICIHQQNAELPKAPGFFRSLWMSILRFFASFSEQSYSTKNVDPDHLQVWVNRSSQYVQVMQKMIDEHFTPSTGIEVDISIMPDQYKLVLANSSGSAPDVATGINYTVPYELAIRGALVDMTQFPDFRETASVYEPGFFLTGTIGNSVYSMPETMNFWVLVYRTDVLEKLGLEVPNTMDDVIDMLPELQMRGLNFYYPTAGMRAMRNFHGTTPLIVQNGGALYSGTAQEGTTLGSEASVNGFTQLTDLFTVYDLPVDIDNFYQHFRNGDIPIGIADYGTYNLISNAAPELASSWDISVVPGTVQADGSIDRSTCGCAESTVIFKSNSQREAMAWEFIKWWSSTEVQTEFGQTMQVTYGDEYLWTTANVEAFANLPLDNDHKEVVLEFAANVVDVARVPGTYMLEREMSNAFNAIVVDGENEQSRIDEAVKIIDREIIRKLEEFGFIDSEGNVIEYYYIPTIESVKEILGRED